MCLISYSRHWCNWLSVSLQLDELIGAGEERKLEGLADRECSVFVCVCDDMHREKCKWGEFLECRCSQSLRVDELFGDVERSGSAINLRDKEEEQWEMNEHS